MSRQRFQSFWHGPALTPYEHLALRSFLEHGHGVTLWTYDERLAVPPGVELAPAEEIVPREEAFVLAGYDAQGGHVAFSNLFRFELLARRGGWWVDLDVICLRDEIPEPELFLALERCGLQPCEVGSAVLRFPAGHELPRRCAGECRSLARDLLGRHGGGASRSFGQLGATLLERMTAELGYCAAASEPQTCYPLHWSEVAELFDPAARRSLEQRTAGAFMLHLWNERLVASGCDKRRPPRRGSFLRTLFDRHDVEFPRRWTGWHPMSSAGAMLSRLRRRRRS